MDNSKRPLVSIYTCVYNGATTIHRVFQSVKDIRYPNIEHIIVNDGSTDETETLIEEYRRQASFPIKYHKKENGGKHTALNIAWTIAEGEFLIQLDADDELLPHAIDFLVDTYYSIPENIREEYWCVHGRYVSQHGKFIGDAYPDDINNGHWKDATQRAAQYRGDKAGLQVRNYLAQYKFPEVIGVHHVPESIIWKQLNQKYGTWYTNEIVGIVYINDGRKHLTDKATTRVQFGPHAYGIKWELMHPELYDVSVYRVLVYSLAYFISTRKYQKHSPYLKGCKKHKILLALLYPFAFVGAFAYRILKRIK